MKKKQITFIFLLQLFFASAQPTDYSKMVNPFIGTGGHGHTFPGAVAPFGMVQLSPDTRLEGWDGCSGYHYSDSVIYGFSHTHLSGTGCSDYGDVLIMPMMGDLSFDNKIYSSKFSHTKEKAHAGFYKVHLDDDDIDVELTTTTRVGFHKYTFNKSGKVHFILDLLHRDKLLDGKIKIINKKTIQGFRRSEAWAKDQRLYFRIEFSKEIISNKIISKDTQQTQAAFSFDVKKGETIFVKVSLSAVDHEGAKKNMEAELPGRDLEKTKQQAEELWNKELNKIQVKGGTRDQQVIFYTALYHCFIHPSIYNDVDGRYLGRDFQIHYADSFNYYTVFSLWDTFRALHPLFNIVQRERNSDFIKTFLEQYKQVGILPMWELSSNETNCMIGYHAVSVIADAYAKGIRNFDLDLAIEACEKSANYNHFGIREYRKKGILETEDENESVSKTLEYAYDDWCIDELITLKSFTNYNSKYDKLHKDLIYFSQSWINLLNPKSSFIQPRSNGGWYKPFNASEVNNNYTEANAWQYSFFVPHDIETLIDAMGGKEKFEKKLDELFSTSSKIEGRQQADISGMIGQYAHGNEPSHHMAYLYNYVGKPEKTQHRVNQILNEMYKNAQDGLAGNEDCGQMSAWYVLSAMGIYPVCPGYNGYAKTSSVFDEIYLNGKKLEIEKLPGIFSNESNLKRSIIPAPIIEAEKKSFKDSLLVSISSMFPENKIEYRVEQMNNLNPEIVLIEYSKPFYIYESSIISAIAENEKQHLNSSSQARFYKMPNDFHIQLNTKYDPQYTAGGDEAVIDGIHGDKNWRKGNWQGYWGNDFEAVIDMKKDKEFSTMSANFLQDPRAWILFPNMVEFFISDDGVNFKTVGNIQIMVSRNSQHEAVGTGLGNEISGTKKYELSLAQKVKVRFVKIKATNFGKLPVWHESAGENAWLFVDEIEVK